MPIQNRSVQEDRSLEDVARQGNIKYTTPTFDEIRKDLSSLQSDVALLAADVRKAGSDKANAAIGYVSEQIGTLKEAGTTTVGAVEERIKSKPGQSITIAFAAGLLISYLFGRRP
jgi:ElaB/YqjD/DUF883 family membrane-anchored ribosome-binding protein